MTSLIEQVTGLGGESSEVLQAIDLFTPEEKEKAILLLEATYKLLDGLAQLHAREIPCVIQALQRDIRAYVLVKVATLSHGLPVLYFGDEQFVDRISFAPPGYLYLAESQKRLPKHEGQKWAIRSGSTYGALPFDTLVAIPTEIAAE